MKQTTNFSIVILGLGQEILVKRSCCQEPSRKEGRMDRVANPAQYPISWGNRRTSDPTDTEEAGTADERKPSVQSFPICRRSVQVLYVKFRNENFERISFTAIELADWQKKDNKFPALETSHKNQSHPLGLHRPHTNQ